MTVLFLIAQQHEVKVRFVINWMFYLADVGVFMAFLNIRIVNTLSGQDHIKGAICKNLRLKYPKNELHASKEWEEIRLMMSLKNDKL